MQNRSKNNHSFKPPFWAKNRHVQTIWPRFFQKRLSLETRQQRLELPDGDFVDLAWSPRPENCKGLIPMFHGLEGSINSHYANDMVARLVKDGWWVVLMHFRGCSGAPNRLPRSYHSGDTGDALFFLEYLKQKLLDVPIKAAIGFSLGANMLLKLLGEQPKQNYVKSAIAISPPFKLSECSDSIAKGFSNIYQKYLLASMCNNVLTKMKNINLSNYLTIKPEQVSEIKSFREFDEHITAPLHGFEDANDYYNKSSCIHFLKKIETPTLVIHAKDDPFMNETVVPEPEQMSSQIQLEVSEKGGHVGFIQGTPWRPQMWLHDRILNFLNA